MRQAPGASQSPAASVPVRRLSTPEPARVSARSQAERRPGIENRATPGRRGSACASRSGRSRLCRGVGSLRAPQFAKHVPASRVNLLGVSISTIKTIGILSPGEMGSGVGTVLHQHGVRVLTCLAGRGSGSRERAARAGIEDVAALETLVREGDVVLSLVPPAVAGAVADQVAAAV